MTDNNNNNNEFNLEDLLNTSLEEIVDKIEQKIPTYKGDNIKKEGETEVENEFILKVGWRNQDIDRLRLAAEYLLLSSKQLEIFCRQRPDLISSEYVAQMWITFITEMASEIAKAIAKRQFMQSTPQETIV